MKSKKNVQVSDYITTQLKIKCSTACKIEISKPKSPTTYSKI